MIEHFTHLQENIKKRVSIYQNYENQAIGEQLIRNNAEWLFINFLATVHQMSSSSSLSVTVFFPENGNINLFTENTRITGKLLVYHKYETEPSKRSLKLTKPQEKKTQIRSDSKWTFSANQLQQVTWI